jgi:DNA-binding IclR family transcriptional regulator
MAGNSMTPGRSVISKVSAILLTVAEDDRSTLTEIASRTDLPLSTCHRLVAELTAWGVLERTGDSRFRAGPPLRKISGPGRCHHDEAVSGIREQVAPVMEDLLRVTGAPVRVGFLDGLGVAYVEKSSAHVPVSDLSPARLPVHATAVGKALLAFTSPRTAALILAGNLHQYTPRTITQPDRLRLDLRTVRATRLALCDGELQPQWSAVAMPVLGLSGSPLVAVELRVRNLARDVPAWRPALAVAASALCRELAGARDGYPARPVTLLPPPVEPHTSGTHMLPLTAAGPRRAGSVAGQARDGCGPAAHRRGRWGADTTGASQSWPPADSIARLEVAFACSLWSMITRCARGRSPSSYASTSARWSSTTS